MISQPKPLPSFVTVEVEKELMANIVNKIGNRSLRSGNGRSRIVRWGYDYDPPHNLLDAWPAWLPDPEMEFDSVTLNEYLPDRAIAPHIDSRAFGDTIAILSLLSSCFMRLQLGDHRVDIKLEPRSMLYLQGIWRTAYTHEILPVDSLRYSIVYRKKL